METESIKAYAHAIPLRKGETHSSGSSHTVEVAIGPLLGSDYKSLCLARVPIRIEVDAGQTMAGEAFFLIASDGASLEHMRLK